MLKALNILTPVETCHIIKSNIYNMSYIHKIIKNIFIFLLLVLVLYSIFLYIYYKQVNKEKFIINDDENELNCKWVSSEGIHKSCDISIMTEDELYRALDYNKTNNNDIPTIYVHIWYLGKFTKIIDMIHYKFILVSGHDDYTVPDDIFINEADLLNFINNKKLIHWYAQNSKINNDKITPIPIGLDYHTLSKKDFSWGSKMTPVQQELELDNIRSSALPFWDRELKCYANYHFQTYGSKFGYDREDIAKVIPNNLVVFQDKLMKRKDSWENQTKYAFVISPHGNGLDCHRTWEALVLGNIVIVRKSEIDVLYEDLPVLIVDEWSDITQELLEKTVYEFKNKTFNYDRLLLKYWTNKINSSRNLD
jgi:hypothetical protein